MAQGFADEGLAVKPVGIPAGGATDEVLTKLSGADGDADWAAAAGGGGGGGAVSYGRASRSTDFSITTGSTWEAIPWEVEDYDIAGYIDIAGNPTRFTAPVAGTYRFSASIIFNATDGSDNICGWHKNGSAVDWSDQLFGRGQPETNTWIAHSGSDIIELAAGDYVEVVVYSTGTLRDIANYSAASLELVTSATTLMFDLLHSTKPTADTPDDEFDATTLDGKWTAVTGASGTVDLAETGEVQKYDLTTRPGWLLLQAGSAADQKVELRQDFTMVDGSSIVVALAFGWAASDGDTGVADDEQWLGIAINDTDSGYDAGAYLQTAWDVAADGARIRTYDGTSVLGALTDSTNQELIGVPGSVVFFRIARSGTTYRVYVSGGGVSWTPLGSKVIATAPNNLWVFAESVAASGEPVPIHAVAWVRQGANTLDPWNPVASVAVASGGESYILNPADKPPATPHADDDEFDGTSLDVAWTWRNQGTATASVDFGRLQLAIPAAASYNWRILEKAIPSTPYTITAKMYAIGLNTNFMMGGLGWNDGTKLFVPAMMISESSTFRRWYWGARWTSVTAYDSAAASGEFYDWARPVYQKIEDDGTTLTWSVSTNGLDWYLQSTQTRAAWPITPTNWFVGINESNNTGKSKLVVDWVRVNWTPDWVPA